jgi:serine/threonine-protein phosphatase CPPED1
VKRLLLLVSILPFLVKAQSDTSFYFIQLADPQFGMYPLQRDFHKERENLSRAVDAINRLRPAFVVICGDLVNNRNDRRQLEAFRQTVATLDKEIPLYLVPGNHDLGNVPTPKTIGHYRRNFGPDYYSFNRGGWTFVVLNSVLIKAPSKAQDEAQEQLRWLTATLDTARTRKSSVIVFQHHPWFVRYPNEPNGYYNVPRKTRKEYLDLLVSHNASYVFAGHLHQNASGKFKTLSVVTSGPIGMPLATSPPGLRIVTIRGSTVEHRYYGLKNIPQKMNIDAAQNPGSR